MATVKEKLACRKGKFQYSPGHREGNEFIPPGREYLLHKIQFPRRQPGGLPIINHSRFGDANQTPPCDANQETCHHPVAAEDE